MVSVTIDRFYRSLKKRLTVKQAAILTLAICTIFMSINLLQFKNSDLKLKSDDVEEDERVTYMLHGDRLDSGYLEHVINVLGRLGIKRIENSTDFDLLWSHPYPFGESAPFSRQFMQNLRPYQKVSINIVLKKRSGIYKN